MLIGAHKMELNFQVQKTVTCVLPSIRLPSTSKMDGQTKLVNWKIMVEQVATVVFFRCLLMSIHVRLWLCEEKDLSHRNKKKNVLIALITNYMEGTFVATQI